MTKSELPLVSAMELHWDLTCLLATSKTVQMVAFPCLSNKDHIEESWDGFKEADLCAPEMKTLVHAPCREHGPETAPSPAGCQPARMAAMSLLNDTVTTNSESSCMDPLQGQRNIISGIINKHNWSVCNMMCTLQIKQAVSIWKKRQTTLAFK